MSKSRSTVKDFKTNNYIYTKAIIYCRVSSDRQVKEGHGLESQEKRCIDYAKSKKLIIEKVFRDEGFSGGKIERPGINKLIDYIDENPLINFVVIFDDLSRLARDVIVYASLKHTLEQRGCKLESPNFQFDDTEENELMQNVTTAFNQYDRKKNRRGVIQKQKARLESGYWCFCNPVGLEYYNHPFHKKLLRPAPYAHILKDAFEKFATNRLITQDEVAKLITKEYKIHDIRDQNGKMRRISANGIKRLLINPLFAGYIEYKPWEVSLMKAQHEGIISFDTFNNIQDKLNGKAKKRTRKDYSLVFPLRGYVLCDNCLKAFTASCNKGRSKHYENYVCHNKDCALSWKSISKDKIEPEFEMILSNLKPNPKMLEMAIAVFKNEWQERAQNHDKYHSPL